MSYLTSHPPAWALAVETLIITLLTLGIIAAVDRWWQSRHRHQMARARVRPYQMPECGFNDCPQHALPGSDFCLAHQAWRQMLVEDREGD